MTTRIMTAALLSLIAIACGCGDAQEPPVEDLRPAVNAVEARTYHVAGVPTDDADRRRYRAVDMTRRGNVHLLGKPAVSLGEDPAWDIDPYDSRSWRWALHSFAWMNDLLSVALAEGDTTHLVTARELCLDWVADNLAHARSDMTWHDHATALRANMIMAYIAVADSLGMTNVGGSVDLEVVLDEHAERLAAPDFYSRRTNHGYDQARTLLLLALRSRDERAAAWFAVADERLTDEIDFAFTADGVHKENSPAYHNRVLSLLFTTRDLDRTWSLVGRDLDTLISKALHFTAAIAQPDGVMPMFGDTSGGRSARIAVPDWVAGRDEILYGMTRGAEGSPPAEADLMLPDSGWMIMRDAWHAGGDSGVHLVVKGGTLSTYHFHDDIQSFTLWGHGERWVVDPGLFAYEYDDPRRIHMTGRRAHNVVLIDDADVSAPKSVIPSTFVESAGGEHVAHCTSDYETEDGVRCVRSVVYAKPDRILIRDRITAPDGRTVRCRQVFHLDAEKTVETVEGGFRVVSNRKGDHALEIVGDGEPSHVRGQQEPWLQGWVSYRPGRVDPVDVVGFEKSGTTVEFETTLTFKTP